MRPIAISLSPNTEYDDVLLAIKLLFSPWQWFGDKKSKLLEKRFSSLFGEDYQAIAFNSGRSAEYAVLKTLGIGSGDEVAIQAFTCIAVPNSIIWRGARPVYVDIDTSYNIDAKDLEKKITKKTKAVIIQHTFGIPARVDEIREIARKYKLVLIEDCAHSLGAEYKGRRVGTFGDVAFFSFGRDKVLSSVFGGMAMTNNKLLAQRIGGLRDKLFNPPAWWVVQQLLHPVLFQLILPLYNINLGKVILVSLQKMKVLSKAVFDEEKSCMKPNIFPAKMPSALTILALNQLQKLEKFNHHRKEIAELYHSLLAEVGTLPPKKEGAIWLRFPLQHPKSRELLAYAKKRGILLGDWYRSVVFPAETLSKAGYVPGSCPKAEEAAKTIVNFPTYPTLTHKQAEKVIRLVKQWLTTQ